jgi:WD40 repeat protein
VQAGNPVRVAETVTGRERLTFLLKEEVVSATFIPDSRVFVAGTSRGEIIALDLDTGEKRFSQVGHMGQVRCLRFSRDGWLLASGGDDTTVLLWDAARLRAPAVEAQKPGEQVAKLWDDLGSEDAALSFRAIRALSSGGEEVAAWIRERIKPMKEPVAKRIGQLVE